MDEEVFWARTGKPMPGVAGDEGKEASIADILNYRKNLIKAQDVMGKAIIASKEANAYNVVIDLDDADRIFRLISQTLSWLPEVKVKF